MPESTLHFTDVLLSSQMDTIGFEHYEQASSVNQILDLDFEFGALIGEGGMAEGILLNRANPPEVCHQSPQRPRPWAHPINAQRGAPHRSIGALCTSCPSIC